MGTSLVISEVSEKDDGHYTCELETKVIKIFLQQLPNLKHFYFFKFYKASFLFGKFFSLIVV